MFSVLCNMIINMINYNFFEKHQFKFITFKTFILLHTKKTSYYFYTTPFIIIFYLILANMASKYVPSIYTYSFLLLLLIYFHPGRRECKS